MNAPAVVNNTSLTQRLADRFQVDEARFVSTVKATCFKGKQVSDEQFLQFLVVANEYNLNPFIKEIYAFPANGGIQPIVSIDGWLKIINNNPAFDGMEFIDTLDDKNSLVSVTCKIYRKDRTRPVEVTEYMLECRKNSDTWNKWPARMLRHKATIQAARYAFSFGGIIDPDEADRHEDLEREKNITPEPEKQAAPAYYQADEYAEKFPAWEAAIKAGKMSADGVIAKVLSKGLLTEAQTQQIKDCEVIEGEVV